MTHTQVAIVGGGPAGLRAAEVAAAGGLEVTLFEGKPSAGRKLLVAGKGGLNLTHGEAFESFVGRYEVPGCGELRWREILADFDAVALREWAAGLGVETFQAKTGRVYPRALKAAPLLRRWLGRLDELGVRRKVLHACTGVVPGERCRLDFSNGEQVTADGIVFALGGASWVRTGSDGKWAGMLEGLGIEVRPFAAANCGWECEWAPEILAVAEGMPLKNLVVRAQGVAAKGELMVTRYGLEGGAIYQLGATLREMARPLITIDFKPMFDAEALVAKMESVRRNFLAEARVRLRLSDAACAILGRKSWDNTEALVREVKGCEIALTGARPIDEAISSAGGVRWTELDDGLMIKRYPGVFVAGEMIDWEAPTGGYLLQGCFATGTRAGRAVLARLKR